MCVGVVYTIATTPGIGELLLLCEMVNTTRERSSFVMEGYVSWPTLSSLSLLLETRAIVEMHLIFLNHHHDCNELDQSVV